MRTLVASVQIDAPPAEVSAFFEEMTQRRYLAWHPEAHRAFRYVRGHRVETGARAHVEEVVGGDEHAYDVEYTAVVPGHVIEFRLTHPIRRVLLPRARLEFRDSGEGCHFVQKIELRSGPVFDHSARIQLQLAATERHVAEECATLRDVVENDRIDAIDAGEYPPAVERSSPQDVTVQPA